MKKLLLAFLALVILAAAAGCSAGGSGAAAGAPKAVEDYLQALVSQDQAKASSLSCKDWEQSALLELDSFQGVKATLEKPGCTVSSTEGTTSLVTCTGKIVATYNNENQDLSLSARTYKVVQEGGEWRMCGYK